MHRKETEHFLCLTKGGERRGHCFHSGPQRSEAERDPEKPDSWLQEAPDHPLGGLCPSHAYWGFYSLWARGVGWCHTRRWGHRILGIPMSLVWAEFSSCLYGSSVILRGSFLFLLLVPERCLSWWSWWRGLNSTVRSWHPTMNGACMWVFLWLKVMAIFSRILVSVNL